MTAIAASECCELVIGIINVEIARGGSFLTKHNYLAWDVRFFDHPRTKPFTDGRSLESAFANMLNTLVCIPYEASQKRDHMIE